MTDIINLFGTLHSAPELSGCEKRTKQIIADFLRSNTDMEVKDFGAWLCAVHKEEGADETIAFRADMDAIKDKSGCAFHGCGHDGHMTTMCALALKIDKEKCGKNVVFVFQPAEENGKGAKDIAPHLKELGISRIYGFHNIPGYKAGMPLIRRGTFACTSKGLTLTFCGRQSHAAYPETGNNPAFAIAETVAAWKEFLSPDKYSAMTLATIVNISVGEKDAFGVNAGEGSLSVTIRAEKECDLSLLENSITAKAKELCMRDSLTLSVESFDEFPETSNNQAGFEYVKCILEKNNIKYELLKEPMRWSEDFGHYQKVTEGFFFGIGAGESHAALHTDGYVYNTDIIEESVRVLMAVAQG